MGENNCELFGMFGFGVQLGLGVISFFSLVLKRQFEAHRRTFKIWVLDISKQGISSILIHFVNLFIAVELSKENDDNACVWYLINVLLDTTVGVFFIWIFIRIVDYYARKYNIETLMSGNYYNPSSDEYDDYHIDYLIWAIQTGIWCSIAIVMKVVSFMIQVKIPRQLELIGNTILSGIKIYPRLELIIVMIIIPFFMNSIQFWIVDNIIMESDATRRMRFSKVSKKPFMEMKPDSIFNIQLNNNPSEKEEREEKEEKELNVA